MRLFSKRAKARKQLWGRETMTSLTVACFTCYLPFAYFLLSAAPWERNRSLQKSVPPSSIGTARRAYVVPFAQGGRGKMGVQTSHGSSPLQQRAEESHGMSATLTESFRVTCFLCRVFQDLAGFACLMCSASSAVRPHCMVNDTSSRKLGDFARRHQRR